MAVGADPSGTDVRWVVSRYALLGWSGGRARVAGSTGGSVTTVDPAGVLNVFATARSLREAADLLEPLPAPVVAGIVDDLVRDGLLVPEGTVEAPTRAHWDPLAWRYHRASRRSDPVRSTTPQTTPAVAPARTGATVVALPGVQTRPPARDLFELLDARRSVRDWSAAPMPIDTLSRFLWFSARDRDDGAATAPEGRGEPASGGDQSPGRTVSRPYPSGGAVYSLELYPIVRPGAVTGLPAGIYRYRPDHHDLERVSADGDEAVRLASVLGHGLDAVRPPPLAVIVTSRYASQGERYGALAYSLVLKEVGALLQTFYLVAGALGLGGCALGGGTPARRFEALRGVAEVDEPVVGEFVFGPR